MQIEPQPIAHRVFYRTRHGADLAVRVYGAPDCDMAAIFILNDGGFVKRVEPIDADAPRIWAEDSVYFEAA